MKKLTFEELEMVTGGDEAAADGTFIVPQCTCLKELLTEYVNLYGKDKWALSTYSRNCSLIENYINPLIGD